MTPRTPETMRHPLSKRWLIGLSIGVGLGLFACGDGSDDEAKATTTRDGGKGGQRAATGGQGGSAAGAGSAGSGGGITLPSAGAGGAATCAGANIVFTREPVTVALLVDQSLSMDKAFGGGTRWTVVREALLDEKKGFVKKLEKDVRFGLSLYTGTAATCPLITTVPPAEASYDAIKKAFDAAVPIDNTPTGESVAFVTQQLAALPGKEARHLVLATDGAPDTCADPNPTTTAAKDAARASSLAAVTAAFGKGIETHVIAVGKEIGTDHLADLANAGAGVASGAPYFVAEDAGTLDTALTKALYGVRSCVINLAGTVKPGTESTGDARLDGAPIPAGTGWALVAPDRLELRGDACAKLQQGAPVLEIAFACDAFVPTVK